MKYDLSDRLFNFAVRCIKFLRFLSSEPEFNNIRYQLSKSSTSSGANYEEAQAGSSKDDFVFKVEISQREMRETNYWLRIIKETVELSNKNSLELTELLAESNELKNILGSIVVKAKQVKENR